MAGIADSIGVHEFGVVVGEHGFDRRHPLSRPTMPDLDRQLAADVPQGPHAHPRRHGIAQSAGGDHHASAGELAFRIAATWQLFSDPLLGRRGGVFQRQTMNDIEHDFSPTKKLIRFRPSGRSPSARQRKPASTHSDRSPRGLKR